MNELKEYIKNQLASLHFKKPERYNETFYSDIKTSKDIENIFTRAENLMNKYKNENEEFNFGSIEDCDVRSLEIYKVYIALHKLGVCLSDSSCLKGLFEDVDEEMFDNWMNRFKRIREMDSKFSSDFLSRE